MIPLPPKELLAYLQLWIICVQLCSAGSMTQTHTSWHNLQTTAISLPSGNAEGRWVDERAVSREKVESSLKGIDIPIEDTNALADASKSVQQPPRKDLNAEEPNHSAQGATEAARKENITSVPHGEPDSGSKDSLMHSEEPMAAMVTAGDVKDATSTKNPGTTVPTETTTAANTATVLKDTTVMASLSSTLRQNRTTTVSPKATVTAGKTVANPNTTLSKGTATAASPGTTVPSTTETTIAEVGLVTPNTTSVQANATKNEHDKGVGAIVDTNGHKGNRSAKETSTISRTTTSVSTTPKVVHVQLVTSNSMSTPSDTRNEEDVVVDASSQKGPGAVKNATTSTCPDTTAPTITPVSTTTKDRGVIVNVQLVTKTSASTDAVTTDDDSQTEDGEEVVEKSTGKGNDEQTPTNVPTVNITEVVEAFSQLNVTEHHLEHCGKPHVRRRRIVGGVVSSLMRYPWSVGVFNKLGDKPYCGAVIVTWYFVLTAAHCTRNKNAADILVSFRLQSIDYDRVMKDRSHLMPVAEIYRHHLFKDIVHGDDIAMLKLKLPLHVDGQPPTPICLPQRDEGGRSLDSYIVGTVGVVVGWGRTKYNGEPSKVLREVSLPIVSNNACSVVFKDVLKIRDEMICAGDINGTKDACQGDSGGSLMWQNMDNRWYTIGIVSFGVKCAEPGYYGTYTRVTSYLDWICNVTGGFLCL